MERWNWQRADWPRLRFDAGLLAEAEERFAAGAGALLARLRRVDQSDHERIAVERVADEAMTTSAIEGEALDRASVQSSVRRALSLGVPDARATDAERGIAELLVDVCRTFVLPLDEPTLLRWHALVMRGRADLPDVGRWRMRREPMQVVGGRIDRPTVHFEAPPATRVPAEMARFIEWFNGGLAPAGRGALRPLARAGLAHLWFESIHPFADGNGRVGRAISEKALAQGMEHPSLTAVSPVIGARRAEYYAALASASRGLEASAWLRWFAGAVLQAQARAQAEVEFVLAKAKLLARLGQQLNPRQEKALLRMMEGGTAGFEGGMTAGKYVSITRASPATATRDLSQLAELGALARSGERRHVRYRLAMKVPPVTRIEVDAKGRVVVRAAAGANPAE
jgi:Fic family protein